MGVSAETLRLLMAAGLAGEELLAVVESIERTGAKPAPTSGAVRMRRYRERHSETVTSDVTVTEQRTPPKPPKKTSPFPPLKGGTSPISEALQPEKPTAEPAKPLSAWVSEIWSETPKPGRARSGRPMVERALRAAVRKGSDPAAVAAGLRGYYASEDATKDGGKYAKGVDAAISSGRWESFSDPVDGPPPDDDPWRRRLLNWSVNQYWNSDWGPKPGKPGYRGPEAMGKAA